MASETQPEELRGEARKRELVEREEGARLGKAWRSLKRRECVCGEQEKSQMVERARMEKARKEE